MMVRIFRCWRYVLVVDISNRLTQFSFPKPSKHCPKMLEIAKDCVFKKENIYMEDPYWPLFSKSFFHIASG